MAKTPKRSTPKSVETLIQEESKRKNIPTADYTYARYLGSYTLAAR